MQRAPCVLMRELREKFGVTRLGKAGAVEDSLGHRIGDDGMRASGYSEALGFTVRDTMIYKRHLERLVHEEVDVMMERVAGEMDTDEAADLLEMAVEPMRDLIAAMRAKLMVAELQARRAAQR